MAWNSDWQCLVRMKLDAIQPRNSIFSEHFSELEVKKQKQELEEGDDLHILIRICFCN